MREVNPPTAPLGSVTQRGVDTSIDFKWSGKKGVKWDHIGSLACPIAKETINPLCFPSDKRYVINLTYNDS